MTFGLTNAPPTFQTMMDSIFIVQIRRGDTNCFIDNFGIGTTPDPTKQLSDEEFHICVLKEIFQLCRENKLTLKPEKCEIMKKEIPYLKHCISEQEFIQTLSNSLELENGQSPPISRSFDPSWE